MEDMHLSSPQLSMKRGTMYGTLPQDSLVGLSPREKRRVSGGHVPAIVQSPSPQRRRVSSFTGRGNQQDSTGDRLLSRGRSEDPAPSYMQGTQSTRRKTVGLRHNMSIDETDGAPREPLEVKSYGPPMFLPPLYSQKKPQLQLIDYSKSGRSVAEDREAVVWEKEQIRKCRYVRRRGSIVDPTPEVDLRTSLDRVASNSGK
ncbi:hypothetical protein BSL78_07350 [Apostichopus japonicus]|uniref:Uncharacterized protein n=1 Tax=Stichopus japonicus TaxID=307972 RepID=A0A2G8L638_STIJA|nr:hypothetical protein BSL78_07350 [Apostichopus japonicus]